jgi:hypothetical protein
MAVERFARARVREVTFATQGFLFVVITQAYKVFAYDKAPGDGEITWRTGLHLTLMFSPFILARIAPLMAVTPGILLRDGAQVELHEGGLVYTFDAVKRPLFVAWSDVDYLHRGRFGLSFRIRDRAELTEGMPQFQAGFWRRKLARPIRLGYVARFEPPGGLGLALAAAARAGVDLQGWEPVQDRAVTAARAPG